MHTVFIKITGTRLVNANLIDTIWYNPEDNKIYVNGTMEEPHYMIYAGKAVNGEEAIVKIISLINDAKLESSRNGSAMILDFYKDLDNYKTRTIERYAFRNTSVSIK